MFRKDDDFLYWTQESFETSVSEIDPDGSVHPDYTGMLTVLLIHEVVFLNDHWWMQDWPESARKETTSINCLCNDIFAPAADAERVPFRLIPELFNHWVADPERGALVWVSRRRDRRPWRPHLETWLDESPAWTVEYTHGQLGETN